RLAGLLQTTTDVADAAAVPSNPGEDLAHHPRLLQHDLKARDPAAILLAHVAVAIRGGREHTHLTSARRVAFATARALQDLRPLILGDHALHEAIVLASACCSEETRA